MYINTYSYMYILIYTHKIICLFFVDNLVNKFTYWHFLQFHIDKWKVMQPNKNIREKVHVYDIVYKLSRLAIGR